MTGSILVVEDDQDLRDLLRRYLERAGFPVSSTGSGAEAIQLVRGGGSAVVVLDLGLPDVDGLEVLRTARTGGVPVLVLTARAGLEDRIRGLELGADDYVTKPFSPTEVVLRVRAVARRAGGGPAEAPRTCYGAGRLCIDEQRHQVRVGGRPVDLTRTEWGLLTALATVPGRVYSRYELVNRVRGYEFAGYERTIDSHVKNLRRKLTAAGLPGDQVVETVVGVGYRLGLAHDHLPA